MDLNKLLLKLNYNFLDDSDINPPEGSGRATREGGSEWESFKKFSSMRTRPIYSKIQSEIPLI